MFFQYSVKQREYKGNEAISGVSRYYLIVEGHGAAGYELAQHMHDHFIESVHDYVEKAEKPLTNQDISCETLERKIQEAFESFQKTLPALKNIEKSICAASCILIARLQLTSYVFSVFSTGRAFGYVMDSQQQTGGKIEPKPIAYLHDTRLVRLILHIELKGL